MEIEHKYQKDHRVLTFPKMTTLMPCKHVKCLKTVLFFEGAVSCFVDALSICIVCLLHNPTMDLLYIMVIKAVFSF